MPQSGSTTPQSPCRAELGGVPPAAPVEGVARSPRTARAARRPRARVVGDRGRAVRRHDEVPAGAQQPAHLLEPVAGRGAARSATRSRSRRRGRASRRASGSGGTSPLSEELDPRAGSSRAHSIARPFGSQPCQRDLRDRRPRAARSTRPEEQPKSSAARDRADLGPGARASASTTMFASYSPPAAVRAARAPSRARPRAARPAAGRSARSAGSQPSHTPSASSRSWSSTRAARAEVVLPGAGLLADRSVRRPRRPARSAAPYSVSVTRRRLEREPPRRQLAPKALAHVRAPGGRSPPGPSRRRGGRGDAAPAIAAEERSGPLAVVTAGNLPSSAARPRAIVAPSMTPLRHPGAPRLIEWTGERCVPWTQDAAIVYEHFHRYLWAAALLAGGACSTSAAARASAPRSSRRAPRRSWASTSTRRRSSTPARTTPRPGLSFDTRERARPRRVRAGLLRRRRRLRDDRARRRPRAADGRGRRRPRRGRAADRLHPRQRALQRGRGPGQRVPRARADAWRSSASCCGTRFEHVALWGQRTIEGSLLSALDAGQSAAAGGTFFLEPAGGEWEPGRSRSRSSASRSPRTGRCPRRAPPRRWPTPRSELRRQTQRAGDAAVAERDRLLAELNERKRAEVLEIGGRLQAAEKELLRVGDELWQTRVELDEAQHFRRRRRGIGHLADLPAGARRALRADRRGLAARPRPRVAAARGWAASSGVPAAGADRRPGRASAGARHSRRAPERSRPPRVCSCMAASRRTRDSLIRRGRARGRQQPGQRLRFRRDAPCPPHARKGRPARRAAVLVALAALALAAASPASAQAAEAGVVLPGPEVGAAPQRLATLGTHWVRMFMPWPDDRARARRLRAPTGSRPTNRPSARTRPARSSCSTSSTPRSGRRARRTTRRRPRTRPTTPRCSRRSRSVSAAASPRMRSGTRRTNRAGGWARPTPPLHAAAEGGLSGGQGGRTESDGPARRADRQRLPLPRRRLRGGRPRLLRRRRRPHRHGLQHPLPLRVPARHRQPHDPRTRSSPTAKCTRSWRPTATTSRSG